jgi:hypothetical protein
LSKGWLVNDMPTEIGQAWLRGWQHDRRLTLGGLGFIPARVAIDPDGAGGSAPAHSRNTVQSPNRLGMISTT